MMFCVVATLSFAHSRRPADDDEDDDREVTYADFPFQFITMKTPHIKVKDNFYQKHPRQV